MSNIVKHIFYCTIESDLLICCSIVGVLRAKNPKPIFVLIIPSHPRIRDIYIRYESFFDHIYIIEQVSFNKHYFGNFKLLRVAKTILRQIFDHPKIVFFSFDVYDLIDLYVYKEIKRVKKSVDVTLIILTAFETNSQIYFKTYDFRKSFAFSIYSIFLINKLFFSFKLQGSGLGSVNHVNISCDYQICFENSSHRTKANVTIKNVEYPISNLIGNPILYDYQDLDKNSVILFIDSLVGGNSPTYWDIIRGVTGLILSSGQNLYIKDHPQSNFDIKTELEDYRVQYIDNKLISELILLKNIDKIDAIFGHGTTALITGSWLQIPAYDLTGCFAFGKELQNILKNFVASLGNVKLLNNREEIQKVVTDLGEIANTAKTQLATPKSKIDSALDDIFSG